MQALRTRGGDGDGRAAKQPDLQAAVLEACPPRLLTRVLRHRGGTGDTLERRAAADAAADAISSLAAGSDANRAKLLASRTRA